MDKETLNKKEGNVNKSFSTSKKYHLNKQDILINFLQHL